MGNIPDWETVKSELIKKMVDRSAVHHVGALAGNQYFISRHVQSV